MSDQSSFDIIIAGAGASGLSLLWNLLQSDVLNRKKILLLDQSLVPANDKTWCFWEKASLPGQELIHHTWPTLQVRAFDDIFSEKLDCYQYHCIRSIDYSTSILQLAASHPSVTCLETSITGFKSAGDHSIVHTTNGDFSAEWIFQSAVKPKNFHSLPVDISLKQHFMGVEIETKEPVFDPDTAMLMDFDTSQAEGVTFFYVLPFTQTKALVEYTFFTENVLTEDQYMRGIRAYLHNRYELSDNHYTISRTELGSIPMEDRRYPAWHTDRVMNIGTVGGLTKPSTGYTFTRIQRHSKSLVRALENGDPLPEANRSDYRFRVYDMMLLYLLKSDPAICKKIFHDLFQKNSFDKILRFLEEDTRVPHELSIFSSLPYTPFFKAIYQMKHRIFTGA